MEGRSSACGPGNDGLTDRWCEIRSSLSELPRTPFFRKLVHELFRVGFPVRFMEHSLPGRTMALDHRWVTAVPCPRGNGHRAPREYRPCGESRHATTRGN